MDGEIKSAESTEPFFELSRIIEKADQTQIEILRGGQAMTAWIVVVTNGLFFGASATTNQMGGSRYLIVILGVQALCAVLHHINCRLYINGLTSRILFLNLQSTVLRQNPAAFRERLMKMDIIELHKAIQRLSFLNNLAVSDSELLARNLNRGKNLTGIFGYFVVILFLAAFASLMVHIW